MEMTLFRTNDYTVKMHITDSNLACIKIQQVKQGMIHDTQSTIYQNAEKVINDVNNILADGRDYVIASLRDKAEQRDNIDDYLADLGEAANAIRNKTDNIDETICEIEAVLSPQ